MVESRKQSIPPETHGPVSENGKEVGEDAGEVLTPDNTSDG